MNMPEQQRATPKTPQEVIRLERDLAKYANLMDSVIRIPFTKQGVGADAALGTIPVAGDVAGFALTCYAIYKAKQIGVPQHKLNVVYKLAVMDLLVGFIPIAGTIFDIFIRPSRKALDVVHEHIREEYQIHDTAHVVHPYLHEKLEMKQQHSAFWRQPVIAWLWLHIPDLVGLVFIIGLLLATWYGFTAVWAWVQNWS
jgi:hypothetical protein